MPLAKRRFGPVAPVPVSAPPSNSQITARPEPLCSPNARIAPLPWLWSRGPSALCGPYSTAGSSLKVPSRSINAPFGSFLPPRLATSTLPSATIEVAKSSTIGPFPFPGSPGRKGRGGSPPFDAAVRSHQHRAGGIDKMDRHQPLGRRHFGPVADPADMSGIAQRDRGKARRLAFFDADLDGLGCDGLPVTELAVDHRQRRRIDHEFDSLVGDDRARLLPPDIDRYPDHAVAVVACQIRGRQGGA